MHAWIATLIILAKLLAKTHTRIILYLVLDSHNFYFQNNPQNELSFHTLSTQRQEIFPFFLCLLFILVQPFSSAIPYLSSILESPWFFLAVLSFHSKHKNDIVKHFFRNHPWLLTIFDAIIIIVVMKYIYIESLCFWVHLLL